jgi:hypothetical protein
MPFADLLSQPSSIMLSPSRTSEPGFETGTIMTWTDHLKWGMDRLTQVRRVGGLSSITYNGYSTFRMEDEVVLRHMLHKQVVCVTSHPPSPTVTSEWQFFKVKQEEKNSVPVQKYQLSTGALQPHEDQHWIVLLEIYVVDRASRSIASLFCLFVCL